MDVFGTDTRVAAGALSHLRIKNTGQQNLRRMLNMTKKYIKNLRDKI